MIVGGVSYAGLLQPVAVPESPPEPPVTQPEPPVVSGSIPLSFDDARFASNTKSGPTGTENGGTTANKTIVDSSDSVSFWIGDGGGAIRNCRSRSREGIRVGGGGSVVIDSSYIEAKGIAGDHADGLQTYAPGKRGSITVRNTTFKCASDKNSTAGFFVADNWTGAIDFENVVFCGGPYGCRIHPDTGGDNILRFKNVFFVGPFMYGAMRMEDAGGHKNKIELWENVREATIVNGALVPGNLIPRPL